MEKDELVEALSRAARGGDGGGEPGGPGGPGDRGPDDGHVRAGDETPSSIRYSQDVTSLDEDTERPGRSLATTSHEVIRAWAESRGGVPATVPGTEHGDGNQSTFFRLESPDREDG